MLILKPFHAYEFIANICINIMVANTYNVQKI